MIRFETLRFIGESHDPVRDVQVYRGESRSGSRRSGLSGRVTIRLETLRFFRGESRSGSRHSGLPGRVTIRFETLRFIGESHDQVRDAQVYRGESRSG